MKPMNRSAIVKAIHKELPYLRQHFGVQQLTLCGSFVRDEGTEESDIDLVVTKFRRDNDFLMDIQDAIRRILEYTVDMTWNEYLRDYKTQDAVVRNLEVIGELPAGDA